MLNRDFKEIISAFNGADVEYLIVGAYAVAAHGLLRTTGDIARPRRCGPALETASSIGLPHRC